METLFVGRNVIFLPEVDSTNSYAIRLLKNVNIAEGTLIHTANQTQGKGQRGNVWNTAPHSNVTASIVLKPSFLELKNHFYLYQIAALACHDVLAALIGNGQFDIKIKWPNDLLINGRKIAGILIENIIVNNRITWSVIGIGMNVQQCEFDEKLNATSLQLLSGKLHKPEDVIHALCAAIEKYYLLLRQEQFATIRSMYEQHFYKLNEWQDFEKGGLTQSMRVRGTGEGGLLLLEDKSGNTFEFDVKEIRWLN